VTLIEPFAILYVLDGTVLTPIIRYLRGILLYLCTHIRYLLIRFTLLCLKYKYDASTRDWVHAIHDCNIFVMFPSFKWIILRRHFAKLRLHNCLHSLFA